MNKKYAFLMIMVLMVFSLACGFSFSTAKINNAYMARDIDGVLEQVDGYSQDEVLLCVVDLSNAPDDTVVTASWYAVNVEDTEPNFLIDQASITSGSNQLFFDLSNNILWPRGSYRVDLSINEEFAQSVEFLIQ